MDLLMDAYDSKFRVKIGILLEPGRTSRNLEEYMFFSNYKYL